MDWSNERYTRVYNRQDPEWTLLPWEARLLWRGLLTEFDRAGILPLGRSGRKGIASLLRVPLEFVEAGLPALLEDGCACLIDDGKGGQVLVSRNYVAAQEAKSSDAQRKREERARAAGRKLAESLGIRELVGIQDKADVTFRDGPGGHPPAPAPQTLAEPGDPAFGDPERVTPTDATVTQRDELSSRRPDPSQPVTARHSVLCCAVSGPSAPLAPAAVLPLQPLTKGTETIVPPTPATGVGSSVGPAQLVLVPGEPEPEPVSRRRAPGEIAELNAKVDRVFDAYLEGWKTVSRGTRPPRLDDKRRKLIIARLKDFAVDDLVAAARGIWRFDFNVQGGHTGLELALRNAEKIERYAAGPGRGEARAAASGMQPGADPQHWKKGPWQMADTEGSDDLKRTP